MVPDEPDDFRIPQSGGVPWRQLELSGDTRPADRQLEITDVKAMAVAGNFTWGLVKVETNGDIYGLGETYRAPQGMVEFTTSLAEELRGENPLDTNRLRALLDQHYTGTGRIGKGALTGVEIALWDIKGKVHDLPVYELLGGKYRNDVAVYCDTHAGEGLGQTEADEAGHEPDIYTPEAYARAAREVVDDGFTALKFDLDVPTTAEVDTVSRRMPNGAIADKVELVKAVRDEIGPDIDLGMDLHWNFTVETAVRLGKRLEPFELAWLEDPVHPQKTKAHTRVRDKIDIPILAGENLVSAARFNQLAIERGLDIAAPDITKCGGIGAMAEMATVCDLYGIPLAIHNVSSPVGTIAGAHVGAAIPNFVSLEYHAREVPWWGDLVTRTATNRPILVDGTIPVPEGPGLGIELNKSVVSSYLTEDSEYVF